MLSTKVITDFLLEWRGAMEPGSRSEDQRALPFFAWLAEQLSEAFPQTDDPFDPPSWTSSGAPNFEELLHVVERLSYLLHEHFFDMAKRTLPPYEQAFYELSAVGKALKQARGLSLYQLLVRSTNAILDFVTNFAAEHPWEDSATLIRNLTNNHVPHLYSLNYDTALAVRGVDWYTGFGPPSDGTTRRALEAGDLRQIFQPESAPPRDRPVFAQMNGSILFGWIEHPWRAPRWIIARYPTPPFPHRTPPRNGFEHWNDRSALPVMPMITGFRKAEKILSEPYASYYHYLRTDAFRFRRWLVLGYGLGDPHVNAVLESAAEYWGESLRAWVCNRIDTSVLSNDKRARRYHLRRTIGFLGRRSLGGREQDEPSDGVLCPSPNVRLSVDGRYEAHAQRILSFINS